jgi:hypothetical protein
MKRLVTLILIFGFILIPNLADAASMQMSPPTGSFALGSTFKVTVLVDTQDAVNTAEASVSYSNNLELISVNQGSTFYLPSLNSPTKGSTSAYFGGGLPNPGYIGKVGSLGVMTFKAKALGAATVTITRGKALLNDGKGTNSLTLPSGGVTARFNIVPPPLPGPIVSSGTHPEQEKWYPEQDVDLSWTRPDEAYGFSLVFDQKPDTVPDEDLETTETTTAKYADLRDGTWYFHIKAKRQPSNAPFGETTHFKVQVDTEPPRLFDINVIGQTNLNDISRTPTITFQAEDLGSGVQYYNVYVDNKLYAEKTQSPYALSEKLTAGPHIIKVTAFDRVNNERSSQLPIIVSAPAVVGYFQRNLSLPIYLLILVNLIVLIAILFFIWYYRRNQRTKISKEISKVQSEIDNSLDSLKSQINDRLTILSSKEKVEKEVAKDIKKAKIKFKKIDKEIEHLGDTTKKTKRGIKKKLD